MTSGTHLLRADRAFSQALRRAFRGGRRRIFWRHPSAALLSLDAVRARISLRGQHYAGVQIIALERIVGSAGRYQDFDRAFLPAQETLRERWRRIYQVAQGLQGFPPIDVYEVGGVYFVRDGHHRVSVLRELGAKTVEAAVTVLETRVPLSPDVTAEQLDRMAEYEAFLKETHLDELRPGVEVAFSLPGQYCKLLEMIALHRYFLECEGQALCAQGVADWCDESYLPVVEVIRQMGLLKRFPGRTEADLYLWILEHREQLGENGEAEGDAREAVEQFARRYGRGAGRRTLERAAQAAGDQAGCPAGMQEAGG
jgi:hypothetical protein